MTRQGIPIHYKKEGGFTKAFGKTIRVILKRPFIIVFFGILALAYCVIDNFNPVTGIFLRWSTFSDGDIFGSIVIILQKYLLKLVTSPKGIAFLAAALIAASFVIGFLFSGYFSMVSNALDGKPRVRGEFAIGFKKYFGKVFIMSFIFLLLCVLFALFMLIASVPALVITKSAFAGKPGMFLTTILVDIITVIVLFFGFMFFRIYMSFWYPAAISYGKNAFVVGKRVADAFFWGLVKRFLAVDVVFILFQILFVNIGSSMVAFIIKWIFYTLFFAFLVTYVFALFKSIVVLSNKKNKSDIEED